MALNAYEGGNLAVMSDFFVVANQTVPLMAKAFLGKYSGKDAEVNPLYRSTEQIAGISPQLILVGAAEFALSDSKEWARKCRKAGVVHELVVGWGQLHVWALGSSFVDPDLRRKTDEHMIDWMISCLHGPTA